MIAINNELKVIIDFFGKYTLMLIKTLFLTKLYKCYKCLRFKNYNLIC